MAWPLSRYQDYVDNTAPAITAAFLHALQDAVSKIYLGTQTVKALVIDGTGGSAATPNAGALSVSRVTSGASAPTSAAAAGELTKNLVPLGWARVKADGTFERGDNVFAVQRSATGIYLVTFNVTCADATKLCATVSTAKTLTLITGSETTSGGKAAVNVTTYDASSPAVGIAPPAVDADIRIHLFGAL